MSELDLLKRIKELEARIKHEERLERPAEFEYRIPGYTAKVGASAPTAANRAIGESGTVLIPVIKFSNISQNDVYFIFHIPEELDANKKVYFHVVWAPGVGFDENTGNYMMKLEYLVKNEDSTILSSEPVTLSFDVTPDNENTLVETEDSTGISALKDQSIFCHFYRDVANDNAGATLDVIMFEFEYFSR